LLSEHWMFVLTECVPSGIANGIYLSACDLHAMGRILGYGLMAVLQSLL